MEDESVNFIIGIPTSDYLHLAISGRAFEDSHDYWDGNVINAKVKLKGGVFTGQIQGILRIDEINSFYDELTTLYKTIKGKANFRTIESWLSIKIKGDGLGHFDAICCVRDEPVGGNKLEFRLFFDQTELPKIILGLETISKTFPIRGSKEK